MSYSLGNDEFYFGAFKVKGAVEHSEGEVRVAVRYVVVSLWGEGSADTE